jgi:hypothetical protein
VILTMATRSLPRRAALREFATAAAGLALTRVPEGAAGGAARSVGQAGTGSQPRSAASQQVVDRLALRGVRKKVASLFPAPSSAARVGELFLRAQADPPAPKALLVATGIDFVNVSGRVRLRAAFAAARRHDFAAGHVIEVDGWVLARSEAACCALLAI